MQILIADSGILMICGWIVFVLNLAAMTVTRERQSYPWGGALGDVSAVGQATSFSAS